MSQNKAEQFRRLAAECERQAEISVGEPLFREMQARLAQSYSALAETEEWLDGQAEQVPAAPGKTEREMQAA